MLGGWLHRPGWLMGLAAWLAGWHSGREVRAHAQTLLLFLPVVTLDFYGVLLWFGDDKVGLDALLRSCLEVVVPGFGASLLFFFGLFSERKKDVLK